MSKYSVEIGRNEYGETYEIPSDALAQHTLIFGGSGFGKTYFSYALVKMQLAGGASLVVLDPKYETIQRLRGACEALQFPPEDVQVIDPRDPESAPGFNPFLIPGDPGHVASAFLTMFEQAGGMVGDRMQQFLTQAVPIAVWHNLKLIQIGRFLREKEFMQDVLRRPLRAPENDLYTLSRTYFETRYWDISQSERNTSIGAIENQFGKYFSSRLFLRMLNAQTNTIRFDRLFERRSALLVNFGSEGSEMQEEAGFLLAGIITRFLMDAAARQKSNIPVVLMVDEIRKLSEFMSERLRDVANLARERGIRLLIAGQHPGQLPGGMREDLLVSSAVKVNFNPGYEPTESAATFLARIAPEINQDDVVEAAEEQPADYSHVPPYHGPLMAQDERHMELGLMDVLMEPGHFPAMPVLVVDPDAPQEGLAGFMACAPYALPPLYLADGRLLREVAQELPYGSVRVLLYEGQIRCEVMVPRAGQRLPRPPKPQRVNPGTHWSRVLGGLQKGQAVISVSGSYPEVVDIERISPPADASIDFQYHSRRAQRADSAFTDEFGVTPASFEQYLSILTGTNTGTKKEEVQADDASDESII